MIVLVLLCPVTFTSSCFVALLVQSMDVKQQQKYTLKYVYINLSWLYNTFIFRNEGMIMRRSFGIWRPECFKNESLTIENLNNICKDFGQTCTFKVQIQNHPQIESVPDTFTAVALNANIRNLVLRHQRPIFKPSVTSTECLAVYVSCY